MALQIVEGSPPQESRLGLKEFGSPSGSDHGVQFRQKADQAVGEEEINTIIRERFVFGMASRLD